MGLAKLELFLGGVLFGTAGLSILGSKDAKRAYAQTTAAVLRAKERISKRATIIRENCSDIMDDAKEINKERAEAAKAEVIGDEAEDAPETDAAAEAGAPA